MNNVKRRASAVPQVSAEKAGAGTLNLIRVGIVFTLAAISIAMWTQLPAAEPFVIAVWIVLMLGVFIGSGFRRSRR